MTPPPLPSHTERTITRERLRLLSLAYIISGTIGTFFVSILIFHLVALTAISFIPDSAWKPPVSQNQKDEAPAGTEGTKQTLKPSLPMAPPVVLFRIFAGVLGIVIICGWILGALTIYAGLCIKARKRRTLVLIMAGVNCIWFPYGTLLGVATFMTLFESDAKEEYPI